MLTNVANKEPNSLQRLSRTISAVGEVPWSSVAKTTMNCHSKLVLHSLKNNQPVQVVMHQTRQTTLLFLGSCALHARSREPKLHEFAVAVVS